MGLNHLKATELPRESVHFTTQFPGVPGTHLNRKYVLKLNAIPADWHFALRDYDFNTDAKFISLSDSITQSKKQWQKFSKSVKTFG